MDIDELIKKVKESAKTRTRDEDVELLRRAYIIDSDGYFHPKFFSKETVAKDRAQGKPLLPSVHQ